MPPLIYSPRLLIIDDQKGLLQLVTGALRADGYDVVTASSEKEARGLFDKLPLDLLIVDLKARALDGMQLIDQLRAKTLPVSLIVMVSPGDEKAAAEAMKAGALGYVVKNRALPDLLPALVKRVLDDLLEKKILVGVQAEYRRLESEMLTKIEAERCDLGAELHDGLGQQLTTIDFMCAAAKEMAKKNHPELETCLQQIGDRLREAVAQTRYFARDLVPMDSRPDALQLGLAELAERTSAFGRIGCRFECPVPVLLPVSMTTGHLYRIVQEAIHNAIKHAHCKQVTIVLEKVGDLLLLSVRNDGIEMSRQADDSRGLGLRTMRYRADLIGAVLTIESRKGGGVTISCALPLANIR